MERPYPLIVAVLMLMTHVASMGCAVESAGDAAGEAADLVHSDTGQLTPVSTDVRSYLGIPYAEPPVGELRWKPPQPVGAWTGVRRAESAGPACMQREHGPRSIFPDPLEAWSEDCLYLNVWTTARAGDTLPVMVWFHGGGWNTGSGMSYTADSAPLASKGVVVVTVNYRLGVFGYLAHPELTAESPHHASGNYGFLDQLAALQWVQDNVSAFGGDPNRVTIFGESAGSWSVNVLTASPLGAGLFHQAIGQSGRALPAGATPDRDPSRYRLMGTGRSRVC